jgi:hypothetical protein
MPFNKAVAFFVSGIESRFSQISLTRQLGRNGESCFRKAC